MQILDPSTWKWDWAGLPADVQLALLAPCVLSQIRRLTQTTYAFRESAGSGVWLIGSLEELTTHLTTLPVPTPYLPPVSSPAALDPLDLTELNISFNL